MKIYVKFKRPKTIKEFLLEFLSYKEGSIYKGIETYKDKECHELQCDRGRYRSFEDLYYLVNTYFKNVSKKKLISILIKLNKGDSYFFPFYCGTIRKPVMCLYSNYVSMKDYSLLSRGITKNCWKDLFKLINLNEFDDNNSIKHFKRLINESNS